MKSICCIGHITLDKIVTPVQTRFLPGGTAYYFGHAMSRLSCGSKFHLVAGLAQSEMSAVEELRRAGVNVKVVPSRKSIFFENTYGENQNNRTQKVLSKADAFTVDALKDIDADIFHLGSLLADDFPLEVFEMLSARGVLSVDAKGFLRQVVGEDVCSVDWKNKREFLKYVDILKVNEFEIKTLTGYSSPLDAGKQLAEWGVKESCITLGSYGSVIYCDGRSYTIPAYPISQVVDATGCGDTYSAGYLYKRAQGCTPEESAHFASAMSAIKLQASGPFNATEAEITKLM